MELTNNAKATIAFSGALAVLAVYDVASAQANPDWGTAMKETLGPVGPFIVGSVPLLVISLGLAITLVWQGNRAGFILALCLALAAGVPNIAAGIFRLIAGAPVGAIICFSIVFLGAVLVRYAYRGYGELATT